MNSNQRLRVSKVLIYIEYALMRSSPGGGLFVFGFQLIILPHWHFLCDLGRNILRHVVFCLHWPFNVRVLE